MGSTNKGILTIAGLGSALAKIISLAEGDIKVQLEKLGADLKAYGDEPLPADPQVAKLQEAVSNLKADIIGKDDLIKKLESEKVLAGEMVKDLKGKLNAAIETKAETSNQLIVTVGKVKYVVNHGSFPHSAKDIAENPEIAAELLKINGQNVLTKL